MTKVGILIIATGKYYDFVEPLLASIKRYLLQSPDYKVIPFVFTDKRSGQLDAVRLFVKHRPWPMMTLMRYHIFIQYQQRLEEMDYLFYCDADMRLVDSVGEEILGVTVATRHPLFYDHPREKITGYEDRKESTAYIPPERGLRYYAGGFLGGSATAFIDMARELAQCIDDDSDRDIIAKWHDESHLNRYFSDHPPAVELPPSYCYPEQLSLPFKPKIFALCKNHAAIRTEDSFIERLLARFRRST